jgi:hypothetical protein
MTSFLRYKPVPVHFFFCIFSSAFTTPLRCTFAYRFIYMRIPLCTPYHTHALYTLLCTHPIILICTLCTLLCSQSYPRALHPVIHMHSAPCHTHALCALHISYPCTMCSAPYHTNALHALLCHALCSGPYHIV